MVILMGFVISQLIYKTNRSDLRIIILGLSNFSDECILFVIY